MSIAEKLDQKFGEILDATPARDLEAEIGVLSSVIIKPSVLDELIPVVRVEDFQDARNGIIFGQMIDMHNAGKKIDTKLVYETLSKAKLLAAAGGAEHLAEVLNCGLTAAHAVYYAGIVRDRSLLRELCSVGEMMVRDGKNNQTNSGELLESCQQRIFAIAESRMVNESVNDISELLVQCMKRLEDNAATGCCNGLQTGFVDLDAVIGGLRDSELCILAARPSMGKTSLAANIAEHTAIRRKIPTLFVSLEMSAVELTDRMLCGLAGFSTAHARSGLSKDERRRLVETMAELSSPIFVIDDTPTRTMTEIAAVARRMKRRKGLGLIVVDYLQLIQPDNSRDPREVQVSRIARRLKALARELKIPVLCLAQLNRQTENVAGNRPKLSHLRESGAIEQDADVVLFVHREEYYETDPHKKLDLKGQAEVIVSKHRNGPVGTCKLAWREDVTRFANIARETRHFGEGVQEFNPADWQ